jgi:thioredoxin-dependent peroxiredoxin
MLEEGQVAPDFELTSDAGTNVRLSALRGSPVVLYFYPKDNSSNCTTQACGIRDAWGSFERLGAVVLGVSPDGEASHMEFRANFGLPFTLLADPDHEAAKAYGVWGERMVEGTLKWSTERSTFVIDADGAVAKILREVDPEAHASDVLAALGSS